MITPDEWEDIARTVNRLKYASGKINTELDTRGAEVLAKAFRGKTWFRKLTAQILLMANKVGYRMTREAAEAQAAWAVDLEFVSLTSKPSPFEGESTGSKTTFESLTQPPTPPGKPPTGVTEAAMPEGEPESKFTGIRVRRDDAGRHIGEAWIKGEVVHETLPRNKPSTARAEAKEFARARKGKDPRFSDAVIRDITREGMVTDSGETVREIVDRTTKTLSTSMGALEQLKAVFTKGEEASLQGSIFAAAKTKSDIEQAWNYTRQMTNEMRDSLILVAEDRLGSKNSGRFIRAITSALLEPNPVKFAGSASRMASDVYRRYKRAAQVMGAMETKANEIDRREATDSIKTISAAGVASEGVKGGWAKDKLREFINSDHVNMSTEALQQMAIDAKMYVAQGRDARQSDLALAKAKQQEQIEAINKIRETHPINLHPLIEPQPGETLTWQSKWANNMTKARNAMQKFNWSYMPINYTLDLMGSRDFLGGLVRIFKGPVDMDNQTYLRTGEEMGTISIKKGKAELENKIEALGLKRENFTKIGVYAESKQRGGFDNLREDGIDESIINKLKTDPEGYLTAGEKAFYDYAREKMDRYHSPVEKLTHFLYNREMPKESNYWPRQQDWSKVDDMSVADRLVAHQRRTSSKTAQAFTEARTGGTMRVKYDALETYTKHMDDVAYYLAYQADIVNLKKVAETDLFEKKFGTEGQKAVNLWLDAVAKRGGGDQGAKRIQWVDYITRKMNRALTSYRPFSQMKHISNAGIAASLLGPSWYMKGIESATQSRWQDFMQQNVPELFVRGGGDLYKEQGMRPSEYAIARGADRWNSQACFAGAYGKLMKENGTPVSPDGAVPLNREMLMTALVYSHGATASVFSKDLPLMRSQGALSGNVTLDRAITTFQGYLMERYGYFQRDFIALGIKEKNAAHATRAAAGLMVAALIHLGVITVGGLAVKEIADQLRAAAGLKAIEKKKRKDDPDELAKAGEELAIDLVKNVVPPVGNLVQMLKGFGTGVPVVDMLAGTAKSVGDYGKRKTPEAKGRVAVDIAADAAAFAGVPGSSQAASLIKKMIPPSGTSRQSEAGQAAEVALKAGKTPAVFARENWQKYKTELESPNQAFNRLHTAAIEHQRRISTDQDISTLAKTAHNDDKLVYVENKGKNMTDSDYRKFVTRMRASGVINERVAQVAIQKRAKTGIASAMATEYN